MKLKTIQRIQYSHRYYVYSCKHNIINKCNQHYTTHPSTYCIIHLDQDKKVQTLGLIHTIPYQYPHCNYSSIGSSGNLLLYHPLVHSHPSQQEPNRVSYMCSQYLTSMHPPSLLSNHFNILSALDWQYVTIICQEKYGESNTEPIKAVLLDLEENRTLVNSVKMQLFGIRYH